MTQNNNKIICIFGGTGFLGHHITQELARAGYRIKIATRVPESAYELKTYGSVGQIVPVLCDYRDEKSIQAAVKNCDGVINLVGILFEKGKKNFKRTHVDLAEKIALAVKHEKVAKFIHLSALGVDISKSKYAVSKLAGEIAVQKAYPNATILRPSVVFGADDNFFNMFAKLASFLPCLPLIGGGKTKFQPVYAGDIADAVTKIMREDSNKYHGKTYELGGPEIVTFKQIYEILLEQTNRHCRLVNLPFGMAKIQGAFLSLLPKPPLTRDQVKSLETDNIVQDGALGFQDLNINPTAMEIILPTYLACYRRGGRFANKKSA